MQKASFSLVTEDDALQTAWQLLARYPTIIVISFCVARDYFWLEEKSNNSLLYVFQRNKLFCA